MLSLVAAHVGRSLGMRLDQSRLNKVRALTMGLTNMWAHLLVAFTDSITLLQLTSTIPSKKEYIGPMLMGTEVSYTSCSFLLLIADTSF